MTIRQNCLSYGFPGTSHWSIQAWISFLAKGGGQKKRFQYCLNPNSSEHFLYFRAIQGHSGGTLVIFTLQDNVLLKDDFAEYIYHVENAHDTHSIMQEVQYDLDKPRVEYLERSPPYSVLVQFETRSEKRVAVPSNTIQRNRSFSTLHLRYVLRKWHT